MAINPRHIHSAGRINGTTLAITLKAGCSVTVVRNAPGDYTVTLRVPIDDAQRQISAWPFTADNAGFVVTVGGTADGSFSVRHFTEVAGTLTLADGTFEFMVERMYS